jgi:hypothetical protein
MESRVARLEASIEHIHLRDRLDGDFCITWAGVIAFGLGLAGLMAKGFGWL